MFHIQQVDESEQKSQICDMILRALPNWFGIESSIVDYVKEVQSFPFWTAFDGEKPIGFAALKKHNPYTSEVYVMGVLKEYHRHGVGRELIQSCEAYCAENQIMYLTVKTLDESRENHSYEKTRKLSFDGFSSLRSISSTLGYK